MVFGRSDGKNAGLWGFVDSDFAGDLDKKRSLTCYCLYFIVAWLIGR